MAFDTIVIGSGFGGAVAACRCAQAGAKVLVLERGRRWETKDYPRSLGDDWFFDADHPEKRSGWIDARVFPNMTVLQGAGVGGGSLIYANISVEAPAWVFDKGWPPELAFAELKPYYDQVAQFMDVRPVPTNQWTDRMRLMQDAAHAIGEPQRFKPLTLAVAFDDDWTYAKDFAKGAAGSKKFINQHGAEQGTCAHLGRCDIGCDVKAKNTLDLNYLHVAENKHGAEIRPLHQVDHIEALPGGRYQVHFARIEGKKRVAGSETADRVILAAGSLGTTEILLRSRALGKLPNISPRLGHGWSSNGDFLTPAHHLGRDVNPSHGPTIAAAIDFHDGSIGGHRFWVQDGGFPDIALQALEAAQESGKLSFPANLVVEALGNFVRNVNGARHIMPWFAQGIDAADGQLSLKQKSGKSKLHLKWDLKASTKVMETIAATHRKLALATLGIPQPMLNWTLFKDLITPHPLGGCNMGRTAQDGVVDHKGELFGHPRLYITDAAQIPEAVGVNPTRTIAALAERVCKLMASN
jgi:cholesterol oxidase